MPNCCYHELISILVNRLNLILNGGYEPIGKKKI
jgi:hypothetical protein